MHLRMHIEQNVCEQEVRTGFERNSLQTSQRKAASRGSKAGRVVECQSVESGNSNVLSMGDCEGVTGGVSLLTLCNDDGAINASVSDVSRWRSAPALSAPLCSRFESCDEKLSVDCFDIDCGSNSYTFVLKEQMELSESERMPGKSDRDGKPFEHQHAVKEQTTKDTAIWSSSDIDVKSNCALFFSMLLSKFNVESSFFTINSFFVVIPTHTQPEHFPLSFLRSVVGTRIITKHNLRPKEKGGIEGLLHIFIEHQEKAKKKHTTAGIRQWSPT